ATAMASVSGLLRSICSRASQALRNTIKLAGKKISPANTPRAGDNIVPSTPAAVTANCRLNQKNTAGRRIIRPPCRWQISAPTDYAGAAVLAAPPASACASLPDSAVTDAQNCRRRTPHPDARPGALRPAADCCAAQSAAPVAPAMPPAPAE